MLITHNDDKIKFTLKICSSNRTRSHCEGWYGTICISNDLSLSFRLFKSLHFFLDFIFKPLRKLFWWDFFHNLARKTRINVFFLDFNRQIGSNSSESVTKHNQLAIDNCSYRMHYLEFRMMLRKCDILRIHFLLI